MEVDVTRAMSPDAFVEIIEQMVNDIKGFAEKAAMRQSGGTKRRYRDGGSQGDEKKTYREGCYYY